MSQVWVIGQGGLLGSALRRVLQQQGQVAFDPDAPWCWSSPEQLCQQVQQQTQRFAKQLLPSEPWTIFWAAGQGNLHSRETDFDTETAALNALLLALDGQPECQRTKGHIALASSAGAVYAGCTDQPITEESAAAPTTAYGHVKLRHEALLISWANASTVIGQAGRHVFIGRLSTLYGPGQAWGKQQGLISHLARQILRHQPLHIYVPLGTQRDYLHVDDAAWAMVNAVGQAPEGATCRILASERATTVAEILGTFKRLTRRAPRIVTSAAQASGVYRAQMTFRSALNQPQQHGREPTPLHIGIHQVLQAERSALARGPHSARAVSP